MDDSEARQKIGTLTDPRIDEVAYLLLDFGMELVACGDETKVERGGQVIGHIDLIFKSKKLKKYFFIEVSEQEDDRAPKINGFFRRWENAQNRQVIERRFNHLTTYGTVYLYFDLSGKENIPESVTMKRNEYVLNESDFGYFSEGYKIIGKWARNDFFSYLNMKSPDRSNIKKGAIQFFLGDIRAYAYVDSARDLLEYCYVFRRKDEHSGYQRILRKEKIGAIAKKIKDPDFLAFPNTILISCPDESQLCNKQKEKCDCPCTVPIHIPNYFCACRVIDGQHRLLGFTKLDEQEQETHSIPVIVLEDIKLNQEIKTFAEINSGQKKIDTNLILVLQAGFDWDVNTNAKEFYEKQAVEVIQRLNKTQGSPLKGRVFIPDIKAKRKGKITLNTLVSATLNNNFIGGKLRLYQRKQNDTQTAYQKIRDIFVLLKQKLPQYSKDTSSFFLTNQGLKILFRLVQIFERNRRKNHISIQLGSLFSDLNNIFNKKFVEQLKTSYGEGGVNKAVEEICKKIKKVQPPRYKKLITDLRKV